MSYISRVLNFTIFSKLRKSRNLVLAKFSENKVASKGQHEALATSRIYLNVKQSIYRRCANLSHFKDDNDCKEDIFKVQNCTEKVKREFSVLLLQDMAVQRSFLFMG